MRCAGGHEYKLVPKDRPKHKAPAVKPYTGPINVKGRI
jgi:hypothetical protein